MEVTGTNWPNNNTFVCWIFKSFARVRCSVSGMTPPTQVVVVGVGQLFVGGVSGRVTPGPIPNPEAKSACADGTALGRVWESRSPPALKTLDWRARVGCGCLRPPPRGLSFCVSRGMPVG